MDVKLQAGDFYGVTNKTRNLTGFCLTDKSYGARLNLPSHSHELAHFCFVLQGNYTETLGGKTAERVPSGLVFYPPEATHSERHYLRGRHFLIEVDRWRLNLVREYCKLPDDPTTIGRASASWVATRMYREFSGTDAASELALEGMLLELLAEASRNLPGSANPKAPAALEKAKTILDESFQDPPTIAFLASAVGIHPVHLCRIFRQYLLCTVGEYVRQRRIEYARQKIATSDDSLVQIALSAGFADQTHFSRSFKRVAGLTPMQFRRMISRLISDRPVYPRQDQ